MRRALLLLAACASPVHPTEPATDHVSAITAAGIEQPVGLDWGAKGKQPANQVLHDVHVLVDVSADRFMAAMQSMKPDVGLACAGCHDTNSYRADTQNKGKTREMIRMTDAIAARTFGGKPRVTCFTCHRGQPKPAPRPVPEALPAFFANMSEADLAAPVETKFRDVKMLTGMNVRAFGQIMRWFASELGVGCDHCHVARDYAELTPNKRRAREMLAMTAYIANDFYRGESPVMCGTCHAGSISPARK